MSVYVLDHYNEDGAKVMRPVLTREEYLALRNSNKQKKTLSAIRGGDKSKKNQLLQMNYSCVPGDDGLLRGCKTPSNSVGMDIDFVAPAELSAEEQQAWLAGKMTGVPELVLSKREELGLHMLERSASKGYHLVFRRRPELSQEGNLLWASELLGIKYDDGAKDITRVFYSTTADEENRLRRLILPGDRFLASTNKHQRRMPGTCPPAESSRPTSRVCLMLLSSQNIGDEQAANRIPVSATSGCTSWLQTCVPYATTRKSGFWRLCRDTAYRCRR